MRPSRCTPPPRPVPSLTTLQTVDKELGRSLAHLQEYLTLKAAIESDSTKLEAEQGRDIEAIEIDGVKIQDLFLDFTLPGHAIDLRPDGKDIGVDIHNLEQYISLVVEWTLHKGIAAQMTEFKAGFTTGSYRLLPCSTDEAQCSPCATCRASRRSSS